MQRTKEIELLIAAKILKQIDGGSETARGRSEKIQYKVKSLEIILFDEIRLVLFHVFLLPPNPMKRPKRNVLLCQNIIDSTSPCLFFPKLVFGI